MEEEKVPKPVSEEGSKAVPQKSSSNNKTLYIVLAIVAAVIVLPIIAFSVFAFWLSSGDNADKLTEGIIESAAGGDVDVSRDGSTYNIKTDDGSISVGEQKLPDNLPKALPVYDNQKIVSVITSNQDGATVWSFTSQTSDGASKVNEYIVSKFSEKGWTTSSTSTFNGISSYSFDKDNLEATVTVTPEQDGNPTSITYYVSEKAE